MSDWFGTYSIDTGLNAGLDLEMPGLNKWRTLEQVNRSIQARKVTAQTVKSRARKVLELVQKCAKGAPEVRVFSVLPPRARVRKRQNSPTSLIQRS